MSTPNINPTGDTVGAIVRRKAEAAALQAASGGCLIGAGTAAAFLTSAHSLIALVAGAVGLITIAIAVRRIRELNP
ncbi:MAG: hypothetical protein KJZ92_17790 [Rhodocyclaceae bacterium]|nr:hypothetical protein [Rhodocyclaceae bacterium]